MDELNPKFQKLVRMLASRRKWWIEELRPNFNVTNATMRFMVKSLEKKLDVMGYPDAVESIREGRQKSAKFSDGFIAVHNLAPAPSLAEHFILKEIRLLEQIALEPGITRIEAGKKSGLSLGEVGFAVRHIKKVIAAKNLPSLYDKNGKSLALSQGFIRHFYLPAKEKSKPEEIIPAKNHDKQPMDASPSTLYRIYDPLLTKFKAKLLAGEDIALGQLDSIVLAELETHNEAITRLLDKIRAKQFDPSDKKKVNGLEQNWLLSVRGLLNPYLARRRKQELSQV
jgi:hypothetical protein